MASSPNLVSRGFTASRVRVGKYQDSTLWKDGSDVNGLLSGFEERTKPESAVDGWRVVGVGDRCLLEVCNRDSDVACRWRSRCSLLSPVSLGIIFESGHESMEHCARSKQLLMGSST